MFVGLPRWKRLVLRSCFMLSFLTAFWKVFGVAPPQTLYHTRKSDSPTPQSPVPASALPVDIDTSAVVPLEPFSFFNMQGFGKKFRRSTTPDSSRALISRSETIGSIEVYNSYHDSLNSLVSIVDNVSLPPPGMLIMQLIAPSSRRTTRLRSK